MVLMVWIVVLKLILVVGILLVLGGATILCHTLAVQTSSFVVVQKVCRYGTVYSLRLACRLILVVCGFFWIKHQPPTDPHLHQSVSYPHRNVEEKEEETERSQERYLQNNTRSSRSRNSNDDDENDTRNTTNFLCGTQIIVANHLSHFEILHLLTLPFRDTNTGEPCLPSFVTKATIFAVPLGIGTITREVLGCIGVAHRTSSTRSSSGPGNRDDPHNPHNEDEEGATTRTVTAQIVARICAKSGRPPQTGGGGGPLVIFPEGTTTNGTCLLPFHTGAFVPQVAVVPIVYAFPSAAHQSSSFRPTYESIWTPIYLWRLFAQPYHPFQYTILPSIAPPHSAAATAAAVSSSSSSSHDVADFAATVRQTMASQLQVPLLPPPYNYRHKVQYHARLRHRYYAHPRGPLYAMCLAPMQPVLDAGGRNDADDEDYDTVLGSITVTTTTDDDNAAENHCRPTREHTTASTTTRRTMTKTDRKSMAGINTIQSKSFSRPSAPETTRRKKER